MFLMRFPGPPFIEEWGIYGNVEEGRYRRSGVGRVCLSLR